MLLIRSLMSATGKLRSTLASPSTVPSRWKKPTPEEYSITWPIGSCAAARPARRPGWLLGAEQGRGDEDAEADQRRAARRAGQQPFTHGETPRRHDSSLRIQTRRGRRRRLRHVSEAVSPGGDSHADRRFVPAALRPRPRGVRAELRRARRGRRVGVRLPRRRAGRRPVGRRRQPDDAGRRGGATPSASSGPAPRGPSPSPRTSSPRAACSTSTRPSARYWPEFAGNGKEASRVRWLLDHQAGLPVIREPLAPGTLYDWDAVTRLLADEAPFWTPGTRQGYHASTFGHLVGEVVRRVTGSDVATFFRDEIAGPLGLDFHLGLPEGDEPRVAPTIRPDGLRPGEMPWRFLEVANREPDSIQALTVRNTGRVMGDHDSRHAHAALLPEPGRHHQRPRPGRAVRPAVARRPRPASPASLPADGSRAWHEQLGAACDASLLVGMRFALGFMQSADNRRGPAGRDGQPDPVADGVRPRRHGRLARLRRPGAPAVVRLHHEQAGQGGAAQRARPGPRRCGVPLAGVYGGRGRGVGVRSPTRRVDLLQRPQRQRRVRRAGSVDHLARCRRASPPRRP